MSIELNSTLNKDKIDDEDDSSIATSDVLSENDQELLNDSDKELQSDQNIEIVSKPTTIQSDVNSKSNIKSSTVNSKHTDLLSQMKQGKF